MPRIIKPAVGSFTASNITVDSSGRIVAASSGAGAANMIRTFTENDSGTATFTAQPGTSKIHVYLRGAGGGGGGGNPGGTEGGTGGHGGFGFLIYLYHNLIQSLLHQEQVDLVDKQIYN